MTVSVRETVRIEQSPQVVTAALLNPDNVIHWTSDLERFEVISGEPGVVGARANLHYQQGGQSYVMEDELLEMIPNKYFRSRVSGGGIVAEVETHLHQTDTGTDMTIQWRGSGGNWKIKLLLPLMRGAISRQTRSDLDKFKQLVETYGANFQTTEN